MMLPFDFRTNPRAAAAQPRVRTMPESEHLSLDRVAAELGDVYSALPESTRARHIEFLEQLHRATDVHLAVRPGPDGLFEVTVVAADHAGALSIYAGLCTAHGLDSRSADIFTIALPGGAQLGDAVPRASAGSGLRGASPRTRPRAIEAPVSRAILDIFEVRSAPAETPDWVAFETELRSLTALIATGNLEAATEQVVGRVAERIEDRRASEPLYPVAIELDATAEATRLLIRSRDTPGFLFEFAAALTTLRANVVRGEIRTAGGETHDAFWLTGEGGRPISDPGRLEELRAATALVKQFMHLLPGSPHPAQALQQFGTLVRTLSQRASSPEGALDAIASPEVLQRLADLLGVSRFLWEDFLRMQQDNLLPVLLDTPGLDRRRPREELVEVLRGAISPQGADAPGDPEKRLNAAKDREMFRIDLRQITRRAGFIEFSRELADLAEATVLGAAELAHAHLRAAHGTPRLESGARAGEASGWAIAALGKLGGRELGFASDIEMLFVYEGGGRTDGDRSISNQDYFEAFVRQVRDSITARQEGIFELDLRLRPYGTKGALATSLTAFEQYYSTSGAAEQFERMALVRLRAFAGDSEVIGRAHALRDAWVYSGGPLDLANILRLRQRQATELVGPGEVNAKYSPGGLVDLEYFVQALQIEAGAADPAVRTPGTLEGAELLAQAGYLPAMTAARIQESYGLMRRLIDALRVVRGNARDLAIPATDSKAFAYLARRMYYETPADLARAIEVRMAFGRSLWERFEELRAAIPR